MAQPRQPVMPRLMAGIVKDADTGCWNWTKSTARGYGRISVNNRAESTHRVTYEMFVGPVPAGLHIDHLCRNTLCCNPEHLEPVTCRENLLRGDTIQAANAAKTHCINGHPLTGDNLYIHPTRGFRHCRQCQTERKKNFKRPDEQRTCEICGAAFVCKREKPTRTCSHACRGKAIAVARTSNRADASAAGVARSAA